jgi:hypothetical protein
LIEIGVDPLQNEELSARLAVSSGSEESHNIQVRTL